MSESLISLPRSTQSQVGMAACAMNTQEALGGRVQIFPMGVFRSNDGRPTGVPSWRMTPEIGGRIAKEIGTRGPDTSFDYEHQLLRAPQNGKPAPAAGWFRSLEIRDDGVWATGIQWTAAARAMIESGEYRYASPLFSYDQKTGDVLSLINVALTNSPAIDGMEAIAAASRLVTHPQLTPEEVKIARAVGVDPVKLAAHKAKNAAIAAASQALSSDELRICRNLGIAPTGLIASKERYGRGS